MKSCCFFGHREVLGNISSLLEEYITYMITENNVKNFYVGNNGGFDSLVITTLLKLSKDYEFNFNVVLAYMPRSTLKQEKFYENTIFPEGLEFVPKKYAIIKRNIWMLEHSQYVISYITHTHGGAYKYAELAKNPGKKVINITGD